MKITIQEKLEGNTVKREGKTFTGLALPFNTESRNGVTYNRESVEKNAETMIGRPVLWNHDDTIPSIGKVTGVETTSEGLTYELELDEEDELAKKISKKLEKQYISHVSIQALVEEESVKEYREDPEGSEGVRVEEFLELTVCNIPGFPETNATQKNTAVVTEAMLNPDKKIVEVEKEDDPCWDGYKMVGVKTKDGKEVPRCVPEELLNKEKELKGMKDKDPKKESEDMSKESIQRNIEKLEEKIAKIESTPQNLVISEAMSEEEANAVVELITQRVTEHLGMAMEEIREGLLNQESEKKDKPEDEEEGVDTVEGEETQKQQVEKEPVEKEREEEGYNPDSLKKNKKEKNVKQAWQEALQEIKKVNK